MLFIIISSIFLAVAVVLASLVFVGQISYSLFFLFMTFFVFICVAVKVALDCRKYGKKNVFGFLKKQTTIASKRDIFIKGLENLIYSRVFISKENKNLFVCLNSNGVYLFYLMENGGMILEKNSKWYQKDGSIEFEIPNPFQILGEEERKLQNILGIPIRASIVTDSSTSFQKPSSQYPILKYSNAHYFLCKTDMKEKYKEEELLKIEEKIKDNYC